MAHPFFTLDALIPVGGMLLILAIALGRRRERKILLAAPEQSKARVAAGVRSIGHISTWGTLLACGCFLLLKDHFGNRKYLGVVLLAFWVMLALFDVMARIIIARRHLPASLARQRLISLIPCWCIGSLGVITILAVFFVSWQ